MSTPQDPEELFDQMVPQLSQQLVDRLLSVASEYLACMSAPTTKKFGDVIP